MKLILFVLPYWFVLMGIMAAVLLILHIKERRKGGKRGNKDDRI